MGQQPLTVEFDGGSRGNPGPAGIGVVIRAHDGTPVATLGRYIGRCTNNVAEYRALILGLNEARKLGASQVRIRGDSELIVRQMRGEYRVKHPDLRPLYEEAQSILAEFDRASIEHTLRGNNALADRLANLAMDRRGDVNDVETVEEPARSEETAPQAGQVWICMRCGASVRVEKPTTVRPHQLKPLTCWCGFKMTESP